MKKPKLLYLLIGVFSIFLAVALQVSFSPPTPSSPYYNVNGEILINVSIYNQNISRVIYNWNGVNYTLYNNSLILMMNFDNIAALGDSATKAIDVSPSLNYGNISEAVWTTSGKYGSALEFNGKNSHLNISNTLLNNSNMSFAMAAWIKPKGNPTVLGEENLIDLRGQYQIWISWFNSTNATGFRTVNSTPVTNSIDAPTGSSPLDTWSHFLAQYNGSTMELYINGKLIGSKITYEVSVNPYVRQSRIGKDYAWLNYTFNGTMDEVRIWNKTFNANEVYQIYASNLNKYNSTQWYLYINQSKNSTSKLDEGNYSYYVCVSDLENNEVCSITQDTIIKNATQISFVSPTPQSYTRTKNLTLYTNTSINEQYLKDVIFNFNGTNYTIYNNSLVLMLNFDNNSLIGETSTKSVDLSRYGNNFTLINSPQFGSGKYGNAIQLNGVNQYANAPTSNLNGTKSFTLSAWVMPNATQDVKAIAGKFVAGATGEWGLYIRTNDYRFQMRNSSGVVILDGQNTATAIGIWTHVAATYDSTTGNMTLYTNGRTGGGQINSALIANFSENAAWKFTIGARPIVAGLFFNGSIDEVRMWDRVLTGEEIYQQYQSNLYKQNVTQWNLITNNSLSDSEYTYQSIARDLSDNQNQTEIRYFTSDNLPPAITIVSPLVKTYIQWEIDFNVSLNENASWCGFSLDGDPNITMTKFNNTYFNYTHIVTADGLYSVKFTCNDTLGNQGEIESIFGVDTFPPEILLSYPLTTTYYNKTAINWIFNYTSYPDGGTVNTCKFYTNTNGSWGINQTTYPAVQLVMTNFTLPSGSVGEGDYLWNIWCNESSGNQDYSVMGNQSFAVDLTPPNTIIRYPENRTYNHYITSMNYSSNDTHLLGCNYSVDGGTNNLSTSPICNNITGLNAIDGSNTWMIRSMDNAQNINQTYVTFTFNQQPTNIDVLSPLNTTYSGGDIIFNLSLEFPSEKCIMTLNNYQTNYTMLNSSDISFYYVLNLGVGSYRADFVCNNSASEYSYDWIDFRIGIAEPGGGGGSFGYTGDYNKSIICRDVYYFIIEKMDSNNLVQYTLEDLYDLTNKINGKLAQKVSNSLIEQFIKEFEDRCGYLNISEEKLPENITIESPYCVVGFNDGFFGLAINCWWDGCGIVQNIDKCSEMQKNAWIWNFEFENGVWKLKGIRLYPFIILGLIILALFFFRKIFSHNQATN